MKKCPSTIDSSVSIIIFTLNEEQNLPSCLDSIEWCDDIHVVDSFSTDATHEICRRRNVPLIEHEFEGFGSQRNWALGEVDLKHDWVLILDADERVTPELAFEINSLARSDVADIGAYRLARRFYLWGRWLKYSSLYPTWVVRFVHKRRIEFLNRGHGETQVVNGGVGQLENHLIDENLKSLDDWFERQIQYARRDAEFELENRRSSRSYAALFSPDPLLRRAALKRIAAFIPFRAFFYFCYSYIFRFGFLDGRDGFMFCRMKAVYQVMVAINKYDLARTSSMSLSRRGVGRR
jgi:glycosyltransferase involved in cell wall biosynthesis